MQQYQYDFCNFLANRGALQVQADLNPNGLLPPKPIVKKSRRNRPLIVDTSGLEDGYDLMMLGRTYAIAANGYFKSEFEVIYGPARKGVPLAVVTAMKFWEGLLYSAKYCSIHKKRGRDGTESYVQLGHHLQDGDRVVLVGDVPTARLPETVVRTLTLLKSVADVKVVGLLMAFDPMERGQNNQMTVLEEITDKYDIPAHAIVTMQEVIGYLRSTYKMGNELWDALLDYYAKYGPTGIVERWLTPGTN